MKANGWKELISQAAYEAEVGNFEKINLLAKLLEKVDDATQLLRDHGFGCTGMDIVETAKQVIDLGA